MKQAKENVHYITEGGATSHVAAGVEVDDDHPAVAAHPDLFEGTKSTSKAAAEPSTSEASVDEPDSAVVRAWARKQGYDVADKGKLPAGIVEAYNKAVKPS
jgi:hypothetical protein